MRNGRRTAWNEDTLRKSKPESIGEILAAVKGTTAVGKALDQAIIWERWPELAGPKLAAHGHPTGFRDKTLMVEVSGSVWMNRFAYQKWFIIGRINRLAEQELVSDIFIVLAEDDSGVDSSA
ncbi:MAG: hypothetical protein QG656_2216 [Candidatus Hydrogenedentes bacterium]|nr:hypothetical protein [Candidatus Hydrogenedentota bacterium]